MIVAEFTDYLLANPEFFVQEIQKRLDARDIAGLVASESADVGSRYAGLKVTAEHPLAAATARVLSGNTEGLTALFPAIAASEDDETEENTTLGRGSRNEAYIDLPTLATFQSTWPTQKERSQEALFTDSQMEACRTAIGRVANEQGMFPDQVRLRTEINGYWVRDAVVVSLWTNTVTERWIIGRLLRSILFSLYKPMRERKVRDLSCRISKNLTNMNFGRILYGYEAIISFQNAFANMVVHDEQPTDPNLPCITKIDFTAVGTSDSITNDTPTGEWTPVDLSAGQP